MTQAVDRPLPEGALDQTASAALGKALGDPDWLAARRASAAAAAGRLAMPSPAERRWKYLDVSTLNVDAYSPAPASSGRTAEELLMTYAAGAMASEVYIEDNGVPVISKAAGDRMVAPFGELDAQERMAAETHFGKAVAAERSRLSALHYAFLNGGVLVHVPANQEVALPVRIVHARTGRQLATPHTLIVTGANSRVRIIEDYRSDDADILALPVVEIFPGPGSHVEYTSLHRWGAQTRSFGEQQTITAPSSELVAITLSTGGQVVKHHIECALEGRGSGSELLGLSIGNGTQHHDFFTLQDHIAPDTRSDLLIKSALDGSARAVYYGLTRVGLEARRADANQEDRNLLLSKMAKADSDPVLEILTNDIIRCSHGATAGPVDEEQLYYLQSRGLTRQAAEDLLVWAFLSQVLDRVPDENLRQELDVELHRKLEEGA